MKNKYPKVNKDNFSKTIEKMLVTRKVWNSSWKHWDFYKALRIKKPITRQDFYDLTKQMFGIGLEFTGFVGNYKITAEEDYYSELPIPKLWGKKFGQYNGLKIILNTVFGPIICGGVGRSHYGQYRYGHRDRKRLKKLYSSSLLKHVK